MDSIIDTAAIFRYHKEMIRLHGNDNTHALGWRDPHSQLLRFAVLSQIADLNDRSILDAGCGHGDLCPYLRRVYPAMRYFGLEQIPELLEVAIERHGDKPETIFYQGNFMTAPLPATDYVLVCGSFNYSSTDPDFIYTAIRKLFESSRMGMGFNLLSQVSREGLLRTYDKDAITEYCRTLSKNIKVIDNYSDEDYTIFMYR